MRYGPVSQLRELTNSDDPPLQGLAGGMEDEGQNRSKETNNA